MYKYIVYLIGIGALAQDIPIIANKGMLSISSETELATLFDFENQKEATLTNDGSLYFYSDFRNDGLYTFNRNTSYAVFQRYRDAANNQNIMGSAPSYFYDVLFNDQPNSNGFNVGNDISIAGTANFLNGIVRVDSVYGAVVFDKGARHINTSDKSHVKGKVEKFKLTNEIFSFPIGDGKYFRPSKITTDKPLQGAFESQYHFKNPNIGQSIVSSSTDAIEWVNDKEYWTVARVGTHDNIILTLTWHESTTPKQLLELKAADLHIVRWDPQLKTWIDLGGIVDVALQTVTTPTVVLDYGIFTLARIKRFDIIDDVIVYNAVSANGDGNNDYFRIENIQRFPNNTVQIYNRWGVKVYDTRNYDSQGNVFRGISEGRGTINIQQKLPSGTYYYMINYEYRDAAGSRMIKKAGYLHLENN